MGEMAEYYSDPCDDFIWDAADELDLDYEDYKQISKIFGPSRTAWKTREGKSIPIVEMTDAHIINTILMLERNNRTSAATYPTLLVEARKRNLPLDKIVKSDTMPV